MPASEIKVSFRFRVPHPGGMLVNNLMGLVGLAAIVAAVGLLAGWAWALLAAGAAMVVLSIIGTTYGEAPAGTDQPVAPTVAVARSA